MNLQGDEVGRSKRNAEAAVAAERSAEAD